MFDSKSSAIPFANRFLAHWSSVDAYLVGSPSFFLPAKPGIIPPNFNRSGLTALRDTLENQLDGVQGELNNLQTNSGAIVMKKQLLLNRLRLFLEVVDGYYAGTPFFNSRPDMPSVNAGPEKFMEPLRDAKNLWGKLNGTAAPSGVTLPIVVDEGTVETPALVSLALFTTSIGELRALYEDRAQAEQNLQVARAQRDETIRAIYLVLLTYRTAVLPRISANQPLIDTLPRLSPEGGHTPDAVTVDGALTGVDTATVTHSESAEPTLESYIFLGAIGDDAGLDDAVVLGIHTNRTPEPFTTTLGLTEPGGAVSLWVKVTLNTGNERTSERVVVTRPGV